MKDTNIPSPFSPPTMLKPRPVDPFFRIIFLGSLKYKEKQFSFNQTNWYQPNVMLLCALDLFWGSSEPFDFTWFPILGNNMRFCDTTHLSRKSPLKILHYTHNPNLSNRSFLWRNEWKQNYSCTVVATNLCTVLHQTQHFLCAFSANNLFGGCNK